MINTELLNDEFYLSDKQRVTGQRPIFPCSFLFLVKAVFRDYASALHVENACQQLIGQVRITQKTVEYQMTL